MFPTEVCFDGFGNRKDYISLPFSLSRTNARVSSGARTASLPQSAERSLVGHRLISVSHDDK